MRGGTQQQMAADEEKMSEVKKLLTPIDDPFWKPRGA